MREFLHQRRADQAAAQSGRRLREDQIVLRRVFAMPIDHRVATVIRSDINERPVRSGDQRGCQAPALHDGVHDLRAKDFIINAHARDAAAPGAIGPQARGRDRLVFWAVGRLRCRFQRIGGGDTPAAPEIDARPDR